MSLFCFQEILVQNFRETSTDSNDTVEHVLKKKRAKAAGILLLVFTTENSS